MAKPVSGTDAQDDAPTSEPRRAGAATPPKSAATGELQADPPRSFAPPPSLDRPDQLDADRVRAALRRKLFGVDAAPPRLGRYELREPLGAGAMGSVFVARDVELRRDVALKVIRPRTSEEQARAVRRRLLREARAMARLRHPNVIGVFEAGIIEDQAFIAMEYVDGATLREWLQDKPRSWQQVLEVFVQAGRGLAAAHRAGLVHRDFKPENVLIGQDGRVQVTDFGVARALLMELDAPLSVTAPPTETSGETAAVAATEWGRAGTPRYMAPEQHEGGAIDERTDQFAFCVALFEALFGEPPFRGETLSELTEAVTGGRVERPSREHQVPPHLLCAVERGLQVEPERRFADMAALLVALQTEAPPARRWRAPTLLGAGLAVVALASAALFWPNQPAPATVDGTTATTGGAAEAAELADAIGSAIASAASAVRSTPDASDATRAGP